MIQSPNTAVGCSSCTDWRRGPASSATGKAASSGLRSPGPFRTWQLPGMTTRRNQRHLCPPTGSPGVVGDDEVDDLARAVPPAEPAARGLGVALLADRDERLPERPAAAAG